MMQVYTICFGIFVVCEFKGQMSTRGGESGYINY